MLELLVKFPPEREPVGEVDLSSYTAWKEFMEDNYGWTGTHGEYATACRKAKVTPVWH
jgi:hypothetical protein